MSSQLIPPQIMSRSGRGKLPEFYYNMIQSSVIGTSDFKLTTHTPYLTLRGWLRGVYWEHLGANWVMMGPQFFTHDMTNVGYGSEYQLTKGTQYLTLIRGHFVYAPSQWETTLQCNVATHWLGTYTNYSVLISKVRSVFLEKKMIQL